MVLVLLLIGFVSHDIWSGQLVLIAATQISHLHRCRVREPGQDLGLDTSQSDLNCVYALTSESKGLDMTSGLLGEGGCSLDHKCYVVFSHAEQSG